MDTERHLFTYIHTYLLTYLLTYLYLYTYHGRYDNRVDDVEQCWNKCFKWYNSSGYAISELRGVNCRMGSHDVMLPTTRHKWTHHS